MTDAADQTDTKASRPKVLTLKSLEQVRILADALRVRILEAYGHEARTTKQLAKILDEKPSKLYHHVEALEKAGLIQLERTRQNRGTLEKYFRPVADIFKADPSLFTTQSSDEPVSAIEEVVSASFDGAREELLDLFQTGQGARLESEGLFSRFRVSCTPEEAMALRDGFEQWLKDLLEGPGSKSEPHTVEDSNSWGCLIAFYPLPKATQDKKD